MQRNNFLIDSNMKRAQLKATITAAEDFVNMRRPYISAIKYHVLKSCVDYAKAELDSMWTKPKSCYAIFSNIMNLADHFSDDIHFLAFVVQELEQTNDRNFRNAVLTYAQNTLKLLLQPEFKNTRVAFMGMAVFGVAILYVEPRTAAVMIGTGIVAAMLSEHFVYYRLNASLQLKLHHIVTGGAGNTAVLSDGFEDVFGRFVNTATGMLNSGMHLFSRAGERFEAMAQYGEGRQTPRVEVLPDEIPRLQHNGNQALAGRVLQLEDVYARPPLPPVHHVVPSAPPMELEEDEPVKLHGACSRKI